MVATIVLIQDATGNLHDQEDHQRNPACQKIDDQGAVIHDTDVDIAASQAVDEAGRPRTLVDYNMPDQYYISAIRPPAIQRQDFELKPQYFTLVGQAPYCGILRDILGIKNIILTGVKGYFGHQEFRRNEILPKFTKKSGRLQDTNF